MYLVTRTETFAKLFFVLSFSGLVMYIVLAFYTFHTAFITMTKSEKAHDASQIGSYSKRFDKDFKYILLWTIPEMTFNLSTEGQQLFINNNCPYINCFLTTDKDLLDKRVKNFDAVVFSINTLKNWKMNMPKSRSPKQKYVFYSMISADKFPVCNVKADGFFNWTWSYKLRSDIVTPFIQVKDLTGAVVFPKYGTNFTETMENMETSLEITTEVNTDVNNSLKFRSKTKAMMWYMGKCDMDGITMTFVRQLKEAMREDSLIFDIYGCNFLKCPEEGCFRTLERDYYFYLAHEDSFSEDYVTTEVLKGYHHNAVPVVVGGADYPKFLPANSYIDANHEPIEKLVAFIHYLIQNPSAYISYFSWKKRFTIHETNLQEGYCELCEKLNSETEVTSYKRFRKWWFYGDLTERCYPKGAERYDEVLSYIGSDRVKKP